MASPSLTEDTAREAFIEYAHSKCCYGTAPAKEMVITGMEAFNTYKYRLVTFCETRSTHQSFEPYIGQPVDAPSRNAVPDIWDIPVQAPNFFEHHKEKVRVPHTSTVKRCPPCLGKGKILCVCCAGLGNRLCMCGGRGYRILMDGRRYPCMACGGRGRVICCGCRGQGFSKCICCVGTGKILEFTKLKVKWTNHTDKEYVTEQACGIREEKLHKVSGKRIYKDTHQLVNYVREFADPAVVEASQRLVKEHHNAFISNHSRIRQQRQTIELIPITRVRYTWKGESFEYLVFGEECKVTTEDYPASCCCCCVLL
ncbi:protein SSUH2 homolog [Alosa pseudoharengus]|uniref:protein SSUH2 homolog n=1 Tax=Alosa pseudoharengus TaxID=34774 RepID=UPI003F8A8448